MGLSSDDMFGVMMAVNTYPVAVDSLSWDLFDLVFTADVQADFGGNAKWSDLESLKRDFDTIHKLFKTTQHYTGNHVITGSGDNAHCFSYVRARFTRELEDGLGSYEANGWYDDKLVRTPAGWRISHRATRSNWSGGNPKVLETMPGVSGSQQLTALSIEVPAGHIGLVNALRGK
jgi:hypothetical protein